MTKSCMRQKETFDHLIKYEWMLDLPTLGIVLQYLHGYANRLSKMHSASTDETT